MKLIAWLLLFVAISGLCATKDRDKNPIIKSKNVVVAQGCSNTSQTNPKKCAKKSGKYTVFNATEPTLTVSLYCFPSICFISQT